MTCQRLAIERDQGDDLNQWREGLRGPHRTDAL
jgi:hypothetical protein